MFGLSTIKLAAIAVLALAFIALGWTAKHYHDEWVEATATIATKQLELNAALEAAKTCSEATEKLSKEAEAKAAQVRKAQEEAAVLAKKNRALADKILGMQPPPNRESCPSIKSLHERYKAEVGASK